MPFLKSTPALIAGTLLLFSAARASTVATCSLANTIVTNPNSCSLSMDSANVTADAGTILSAVGTTEQVLTYGDTELEISNLSQLGSYASASGDVTTNFYSAGPARLGEITITNTTGNYYGIPSPDANASAVVTDGVHTYKFGIVCSDLGCKQTELPLLHLT